MLGLARFYLAICVAFGHVAPRTFWTAAPTAVFGFYVLSGFLITRVIRTTYSGGVSGLAGFVANRTLRIYPGYLALLAVTAVACLIDERIQNAIGLPRGPWVRFYNLVIVGLDQIPPRLRMIPPAWSVSVELVYYAGIALVLGRTRWVTTLWWLASFGLAVHHWTQGDFSAAYLSRAGPSICFATGAMIYHHQDRLPRLGALGALIGWATLVLCTGLGTAERAGWVPMWLGRLDLVYLTVLGVGITCATLDSRSLGSPSAPLRSADRLLGDLAYPIFLSHWLCMVITQHVLGLMERGIPITTRVGVAAGLTLMLSLATLYLVERPVQRLRGRVRSWTQARA